MEQKLARLEREEIEKQNEAALRLAEQKAKLQVEQAELKAKLQAEQARLQLDEVAEANRKRLAEAKIKEASLDDTEESTFGAKTEVFVPQDAQREARTQDWVENVTLVQSINPDAHSEGIISDANTLGPQLLPPLVTSAATATLPQPTPPPTSGYTYTFEHLTSLAYLFEPNDPPLGRATCIFGSSSIPCVP